MAGVKDFIFVSTILVHGRSNSGRPPFREDDVLTPRGLYGMSKAAAETGLKELADLASEISLEYARTVREAIGKIDQKIEAIAAHGQTLYHAPPNTIQWFDPAVLAAETGCTVVSDFRREAAGQWVDGKIYDPNDGKTYKSKMSVGADGTLKVSGCVLVFCKAQSWTRTTAP